jgi:hypothetical protein
MDDVGGDVYQTLNDLVRRTGGPGKLQLVVCVIEKEVRLLACVNDM